MKVSIKTTNKKELRYFEKGKEYHVIKSNDIAFLILNDLGMKCVCLWENCTHIDGDWKIVMEDAGTIN